MTDDDITRLREAAQAATKGPWSHVQSGGGYENYVYAPISRYGVSWAGDSPVKVAYLPHDPRGFRDAQDAAYIAAASPDVVTRLIDRLERAERERDVLAALLREARRYVEQDAQMMADISRHAPLDAESQAVHDATEYPSERLLPRIDTALAAKEQK